MNRSQRRDSEKRGTPAGKPLGGPLFVTALEHHQAGRLAEAAPLYRRVLSKHPRHADSLHLLGVIAHQTDQHDTAVALMTQAIAIDGAVGLYHSNLGNALRALGRLDEAIDSYRRAIALGPDIPPDHCNLGVALYERQEYETARAHLTKAIVLEPRFAEAHNNLGLVLDALGRHDEAVASFRRAITEKPAYAEAHNNLAATLKEQGALEEAVRHYRTAIAHAPDFARAHHNLAVVYKRQGKLDEAVARARRAIELAPTLPEAYDNLGGALADQGRLADAAENFRKAIALRPGYADAHDNFGTVLIEQGNSQAGIASFREAIALKADFANAHHNLAMALLARGAFSEGWSEYEWRFRTTQLADARRDFSGPRWRGEPSEGRALLIHAEQGFGDTIQFCRYASMAAAAGWRVLMQVQKPLVRLLRNLPGVARVVALDEQIGEKFDFHCPMMSLPLAFGTALDTIPAMPAYLSADPDQAMAWRTRLAGRDDPAFRVGLCWAGNPDINTDRRRSIPAERLASLFDLPGILFVSLQKSGPAAPAGAPLLDFMEEMNDFADTAALIAALDVVISVDTAVAHLAAALGKPVFLLNRFDQEWRWMSDRADSPWYPSLRIVRQPRPGDWDSVVTTVARALQALRVAAAIPSLQ